MATATRMTAEQYYAVTVEGDCKQLVDGEIVVNDPKLIHMELQGRIYRALQDWAEARRGRGHAFLGGDVRLDEHNVFAPDVLWFSEEHRPAELDTYPDRVPDLCVEVRSPSTWRYDIGAKMRVYEGGRLPELWLVDHVSASVLVYRRSEPGSPTFDVALELGVADSLASPQLPGFELALSDLFAE